jgi:ATP-dependent DNA helicase RecG
MAGRPEALFPLFAGLETLPGVGPRLARALAGLEVEKPRDLLFVLPHSASTGPAAARSSRWRRRPC